MPLTHLAAWRIVLPFGVVMRRLSGCRARPQALSVPGPTESQTWEVLAYERLLRDEAEHRFANLLQLVVLNLNRAARAAGSGEVRNAIDAAADQVAALGKLHRAVDHAAVRPERECGDTLRELCVTLEAVVLRPRGRRLSFEIGSAVPLMVPTHVSRCLTLLVSELVINAGKHASRPGAPGKVSVTIDRTDALIVCTVRDDGAGASAEPRRDGARGMKLAGRIAAQAGGHCRWVFGRTGTEVRAVVPFDGSNENAAGCATGPPDVLSASDRAIEPDAAETKNQART